MNKILVSVALVISLFASTASFASACDDKQVWVESHAALERLQITEVNTGKSRIDPFAPGFSIGRKETLMAQVHSGDGSRGHAAGEIKIWSTLRQQSIVLHYSFTRILFWCFTGTPTVEGGSKFTVLGEKVDNGVKFTITPNSIIDPTPDN